MSASVEDLRHQLRSLSLVLLQQWNERRRLVEAIQKQKSCLDLPSYSAHREKELFSDPDFQAQLRLLGPKELLAFSLLWEAQADHFSNYPRWSEKVHISHPSKGADWQEQINPLMLQAVYPEIFERLTLSEGHSFLRNL